MYTKKAFDKTDLLKPEIMLRLYANGAFPMADEKTGEINWFLPEIRTIIPLDKYNVPRSLKKILMQDHFKFEYDKDFLSIVKQCAKRKPTWISNELIDAYLRLWEMGYIHTVETYLDKKLVGGLYGVAYNGAFFGESMFSLVPQASKAALVKLIERLNEKEYVLLDVQYMTPHLKMFGAIEIAFEEYLSLLNIAYKKMC